jgi:hypothetical protein
MPWPFGRNYADLPNINDFQYTTFLKITQNVVTHACNSIYLGSRDWEDCSLRPPEKKFSETPVSANKPGEMVHTYDPSYMEGHR